MAARLKSTMSSLVNKSQSGFMPGRKITYNIFIDQELFRGYDRHSGTPRCALKIDLKNAFDSVRWEFILACLVIYEFPVTFIAWIKTCITTTTFSIKVNGTRKALGITRKIRANWKWLHNDKDNTNGCIWVGWNPKVWHAVFLVL